MQSNAGAPTANGKTRTRARPLQLGEMPRVPRAGALAPALLRRGALPPERDVSDAALQAQRAFVTGAAGKWGRDVRCSRATGSPGF